MSRKLKILICADASLPVPPKGYGGIERIVHLLCDGLSSRGHSVFLMAAPESKTSAELIPHRKPDPRNRLSRIYRKLLFYCKVLVHAVGKDVVINFGRLDYIAPILRLTTKPVVCAFQNPILSEHIHAVLTARAKNIALVSVSDNQRQGLENQNGIWTTIYNGVVAPPLPNDKCRRKYILFLGRLTRQKGVHTAIRVSQSGDVPLVIAGNVPETSEGPEYFSSAIAPHLCASVQWVGEVDDERKVTLLRNAKALLFPIEWDEPFGIVLIESMMCGTPVVAFDRGATAEIVSPGRTGFLVNSVEEMVQAIEKVDSIDRSECRRIAQERFGAETMVSSYSDLCESLVWGPQR